MGFPNLPGWQARECKKDEKGIYCKVSGMIGYKDVDKHGDYACLSQKDKNHDELKAKFWNNTNEIFIADTKKEYLMTTWECEQPMTTKNMWFTIAVLIAGVLSLCYCCGCCSRSDSSYLVHHPEWQTTIVT